MHPPSLENNYCAFSTGRAYAAQHRNYGNCQECKKAHQKCNGSDGSACDRCIKHRKKCSLLDAATPAVVYPLMDSHTSEPPTQMPSIEEETQRFGKVLYARPCNGGTCFEVTHIRMGKNNHLQVFSTRCDKDFVPVAATEYLGPWVEFISRMRASMTEVDVQDMVMTAMESSHL